ncbi:hypothetical protein HJD18_09595 [Thermoleophilia bacterium SCSIO 60948]|nr:hypothetical protein HJD18_09595 [Thermoleophilia bacterium SCSIO 60948]
MTGSNFHRELDELGPRALARHQHDVIGFRQLAARGITRHGAAHRVATGRLFPLYEGVYAVGRREVSREGQLMAAVLVCGRGARLSHESAADLFGIRRPEPPPVHVSIPRSRRARRPGIEVHRRLPSLLEPETTHERIPVTPLPLVLVDLAATLPTRHVERAVNQADQKDLISPDALRKALDELPVVPGLNALRALLDKDAFLLTESILEQRFVPLALEAGLPKPKTQRFTSGHRCDFTWPELGLVAETDGLRYHRTATQQRRDRERDHAHLLAGRESVRFTHWQVVNDRDHVVRTLEVAARRATALRRSA